MCFTGRFDDIIKNNIGIVRIWLDFLIFNSGVA